MKTSSAGVRAIMEREGKRSVAYPDPATGGVPWTIGVGHTGPEVHPGLYWSDEQIEDALAADLAKFEAAVNTCKVPLSQNQYDALVSFAFNVGDGAFLSSTLLRKLNDGFYDAASWEFRRWNNPAIVTSRRAGEWVQFNTPDGQPYPARDKFDARFP